MASSHGDPETTPPKSLGAAGLGDSEDRRRITGDPAYAPAPCHPTDPAQHHPYVPAQCHPSTPAQCHPRAPLTATTPAQPGVTHVPQLSATRAPSPVLLLAQVQPLTVMVDLPANFPYLRNSGFVTRFCATICKSRGAGEEPPTVGVPRVGGTGSPVPQCTPCPPGSRRRACPRQHAHGCRTPRTAASAPPRSSNPP